MRLYCIFCSKYFDIDSNLIRCDSCNQPLIFRYDDVNSENLIIDSSVKSIWRYGYIPRFNIPPVTMYEGYTSIYLASRLSDYYGFDTNIYLKDESRNPTGSFVDRGVSVAVTYAKYRGYRRIVSASPGNLGVSISAYAAKAGIDSEILVPKNVERGKLYQILMYGGDVGIYESFGYAVSEIYRSFREGDGFYPVMSDNPFYVEGVKTISFEVYEDLRGALPEYIIVPVGNGALIYSIFKGFEELRDMGLIDYVPRLVAVQFKGASRIIDALYGSDGYVFKMYAPEITVDEPLNLEHALYAIRESDGMGLAVDFEDVVESLKLLSTCEGLIVELAAASTITALKDLVEKESPRSVLCILTGHGLKDPATFRELTRSARRRLGVETVHRSAVGRTKLEIIRAIDEGFQYGYSIMKYLRSKGIAVTLPTIYQHLNELEEMGLIRLSKSTGLGRKKSIYVLTEKGRMLLRAVG